MATEITELAGLQYNIGDIIRQSIASSFIVDYGIVKAVNADKTVDVTHAVMLEYINGDPAPLTVTRKVEVLFPASASFGISWPIAVGDGVLLVGLKNAVPTTKGTQPPTQPLPEHPHYCQDTLKAIPLQTVTNPAFTLAVDSAGLLQAKNANKSLYTVLNNLMTHISTLNSGLLTFTTGLNAGTLTAQATAMASVATTAVTNLSTDISDLALILKA